MNSDAMTCDSLGLSAADLRFVRRHALDLIAFARERRRALLAPDPDPLEDRLMPDKPDLTDAERDLCRRSGMDPEKYAAIRDVPTCFGGRSVPDVLAALEVPDRKD